MNERAPRRRGRYGIDAPYAPISLLAGGVMCIALGTRWSLGPLEVEGPAWLAVWGVLLILAAAVFLHTTLRGKFRVWQELVAGLDLRGNERVLDLGCGRGMVLLEAARYLVTGDATGVDSWRTRDQSGNEAEATLANARSEGVADRVRLCTADMRELPFADARFDVVLSSLAIHNIPQAADRQRAIDEAARVLRPGGRLLIVDFRHCGAYATRLRESGWREVKRSTLGWRFWYGGPFWAADVVDAVKPAG